MSSPPLKQATFLFACHDPTRRAWQKCGLHDLSGNAATACVWKAIHGVGEGPESIRLARSGGNTPRAPKIVYDTPLSVKTCLICSLKRPIVSSTLPEVETYISKALTRAGDSEGTNRTPLPFPFSFEILQGVQAGSRSGSIEKSQTKSPRQKVAVRSGRCHHFSALSALVCGAFAQLCDPRYACR